MAGSDNFGLAGKIALVAGASRGIGEAIARSLARHGAHVIVASRRLERCETVAAAIREAGGSAEARVCHIGEMDDIAATFAWLRETHGRLDILVNNGATNVYFGPIEDTDLAAYQKIMDVNVRGYFFMSTHAVKLMATHGGGTIVNVASVNGVVPGPMQGVYNITKSAVIGMTKSFARECAPMGIRVNALLPGLTRTKLAGALIEAVEGREMSAHIPMGRVGEPEEMAGAVLYLVSPASSYATGVMLNVDGGYLVG
ncbi:MAG TPA: SDR family oxidoreductase [Acetobacteraceae bacterium]|nr:SDR family oxidoreductase [Acetobacteraceae bacterium]